MIKNLSKNRLFGLLEIRLSSDHCSVSKVLRSNIVKLSNLKESRVLEAFCLLDFHFYASDLWIISGKSFLYNYFLFLHKDKQKIKPFNLVANYFTQNKSTMLSFIILHNRYYKTTVIIIAGDLEDFSDYNLSESMQATFQLS